MRWGSQLFDDMCAIIDGLAKFNLGYVVNPLPGKCIWKQQLRNDIMKDPYSKEIGILGGNTSVANHFMELMIWSGFSPLSRTSVSSLYLS